MDMKSKLDKKLEAIDYILELMTERLNDLQQRIEELETVCALK